MVAGLARCRCHYEDPDVIDHHGLTPDGQPRVVPDASCTLCGGSGQTTRGRLVGGYLGGLLFVLSALVGVAAIGLLAAALAGVVPLRAFVFAGAGSVAGVVLAVLIESRIRKTTPGR